MPLPFYAEIENKLLEMMRPVSDPTAEGFFWPSAVETMKKQPMQTHCSISIREIPRDNEQILNNELPESLLEFPAERTTRRYMGGTLPGNIIWSYGKIGSSPTYSGFIRFRDRISTEMVSVWRDIFYGALKALPNIYHIGGEISVREDIEQMKSLFPGSTILLLGQASLTSYLDHIYGEDIPGWLEDVVIRQTSDRNYTDEMFDGSKVNRQYIYALLPLDHISMKLIVPWKYSIKKIPYYWDVRLICQPKVSILFPKIDFVKKEVIYLAPKSGRFSDL